MTARTKPETLARTAEKNVAKGRAFGAETRLWPVAVKLIPVTEPVEVASLKGRCLDDLPLEVRHYTPAPELLHSTGALVEETLVSHLLKSNCPVTGQPDWGSVVVDYSGPALLPESLLAYLVSFRQHADFHEQCVERIFLDLQKLLQPRRLTVYARYVRRGGLDINPYRSTDAFAPDNRRLVRQ